MKTQRLILVVALVLLMTALLAACLRPAEPETMSTQANTPCYFGLGGTRFVAGRGCTINAQSGSTLQVDDGTIFTADTLTVTDDLVVSGLTTFSGMPIHSTASLTPTDGGTLTPTAEIVILTPGGAVGTALGACTSGELTTLYNSVNAAVVVTDTGNFIGAGNATLGQYDALGLVCISSKWVQISAVSAN